MRFFEHILIRNCDVAASLKSTKQGKACGEHFIFADNEILTILSTLFTSFLTHDNIPSEFIKSVISPMLKSKTGDITNISNYRPTALVTAMSKIFEFCLLDILQLFLTTSRNQFGFKQQHSTDLCIFLTKTSAQYYNKFEALYIRRF